MKIKCAVLDAGDFNLTYGKVYEVEEITGDFYYVKDDIEYRIYMKEGEFEVVEEESTEWSGKGFPPVGTECECISPTENAKYLPCKVIDHGDDYVIVHFHPNEYNVKVDWTRHGCRPIKSEKQKEIEEIMEDCGVAMCVAKTIYEQGYRKTK